MITTRLEEIEKSKTKVYIDDDYAFFLYKKELEKYELQEGNIIPDQIYKEIMEELIYPRAIQKALSILKFMDRCEKELRMKLTQADYNKDIIDRVIVYTKNYGYLNDERFTEAFIRARKSRKSKFMIKTELIQKGVSKEKIEAAFLTEYEGEDKEDAELIAIQKAISKKTKEPDNLTPEEKQKLIASLYRKGFDLSKIKQIIS